MSDDQSSLNTPGITRRSGFTAQSVSAIANWPGGLKTGARNACIQKRTSAMMMKSTNTASSTISVASANTLGDIALVLRHRVPDPAQPLARGRHRLDELVLHAATLEHFQRTLGGAALRGDLGAKLRRVLAAIDGELRGADERPQRERSRCAVGEAEFPR